MGNLVKLNTNGGISTAALFFFLNLPQSTKYIIYFLQGALPWIGTACALQGLLR